MGSQMKGFTWFLFTHFCKIIIRHCSTSNFFRSKINLSIRLLMNLKIPITYSETGKVKNNMK